MVGADEVRGITVTGHGTVRTAPDRADCSFGVETQGATAGEALAANGDAAAKVIEAVKSAGVAAEDVQTEQFSVHPRYSNDGQEIAGFSASNSVTARIREIASVGAVIEAAVEAGANRVHGPTFVVSEPGVRYEALLEAAFADARAKAEALAAATGVALGAVVNVVEGGAAPGPLRAKLAAELAAAPVEGGLEELTASLTVTFSVTQRGPSGSQP
jgi:uncharacterized protein YggE